MSQDVEKAISEQTAGPIPLTEKDSAFEVPCYEGKDPILKEKPYCYACQYYDDRTVVSGLKRCSRCQVAWYCSGDCQKKHFKEHRELCRRIAEQTKCVEQEAIPLRTLTWDEDDNVGENLFEMYVGEFGDFDETQEYLDARAMLAASYWEAAYDFEVKEVWEKALFHYLELLRLDVTYRCVVRFRVPFILLYLNRDDDAYAFIRYWLRFDELDYDEVLLRHASSREGDWLYPVELNCRYLDIFKECANMEGKEEVSGPYLVALAIIKLRIIASHAAISRTVDFALMKTDAHRIQEIRSIVQEMLVGSDAASQCQQVNELLNNVHPLTLDAMHAFEEISELEQASELEELIHFHPFPISITLWNGVRAFFRVPGAADILRLRTEAGG